MNNTRKAWINGLFLAVTLAINALGAIGAQSTDSHRSKFLISTLP